MFKLQEMLFVAQIEQLEASEKSLLQKNARLLEKCVLKPQPPQAEHGECITYTQSSQSSEVETELFIGLPEMH